MAGLCLSTETCPQKYNTGREYCTSTYSERYENKKSHARGWKDLDIKISPKYGVDLVERSRENPWLYRSPSELDGHIFMSRLHTYPGGGYVRTLGTTVQEANATLSYLKRHLWLDTSTRAVFLEFSTYNNNGKLYCIVTLVLEFNPDGGVIPYSSVITTRLERFNNTFSLILEVCEIWFLLFTHFFLLQELLEIRKKGWSHLQEPKCIFELLIFAATVISIAFTVIHLNVVTLFKNRYNKNREVYINLQFAATTDSVLHYALATISFFAVLKLLKALSINKSTMSLYIKLQLVAGEIFRCGAFVLVALFAYASWGYLAFGRVLEGYATFLGSVMSILNLVLGNLAYRELMEANRIMALLFLAFFFLTTTLIFLNVLKTLALHTYTTMSSSSKDDIVQFWQSKLAAHFRPFISIKKQKSKVTRSLRRRSKRRRRGERSRRSRRSWRPERYLQHVNSRTDSNTSNVLKSVCKIDNLAENLLSHEHEVIEDMEKIVKIIESRKTRLHHRKVRTGSTTKR